MSDELEAVGKLTLSVHGDIYRVTSPAGIETEVDRIAEHHDDLTAEVTIRSSRTPRPGLLHSARFNLMSTQTRKTVASALARREPDLDWDGFIEGLCFLVRERYRAGDPTIDLRTHERERTVRSFVSPFVEYGGPTTIAAHGGTGKTRIVSGIAVTAATGVAVIGQLHGDPVPVMVGDWETDPDITQETIDAILVGAGIRERPPIFYRRMVASLPESAATVRREIERLGVRLFICDSIGMARGGEPESADMTLRLFAAARSLEVPVLFTDHVTNAEARDAKKPFGSAYTWNASRLVWTMDKAQEEGQDALAVTLVNRKRNNGRLLPRVSYRIEFENGVGDAVQAIRYKHIDAADEPGLAERLPLKQRILAELRDGGVDLETLVGNLNPRADERGAKQVRSRVGELLKRGAVRRMPDGMIWLATGRSA